MMTINIYFDDTVKAHDKKTTGGHYVERYYIKEFEEPSAKYPAGRMKEKEIDIGDATVDQINMQNKWRDPDDRVPKVYKKKVWKRKARYICGETSLLGERKPQTRHCQ